MNFRILSRVIGLLLFLLAGAMMTCLGYARFTEEYLTRPDAEQALLNSIAFAAGIGLILFLGGRRSGEQILRKEAIAIVGLGWLTCAVVGALPFVMSEPGLSAPAALFESMSGFTTTGSTVIADLDEYPRSILLWRSLTQWLGGMGILVLFVALLSYLGVGSKAIFHHESSAKSGSGGLQARIHDVAVRMWQIYMTLSIVCCLGLKGLGLSWYDAVTHTFTALSTGGFSPYNASIAHFDNLWIELWLVAFMILGGISFMLYAWLLRRRWDRWKNEEETKLFLVVITIATTLVTLDLIALNLNSPGASLRESLFQVVSIVTTTGFATADFDQWPVFSRLVLVGLMLIGGCAGSTSGSIKVSRWLLFIKIIRIEVIKAFRPNQVIAVRLNGAPADDQLRMQTVFFIALAGVFVAFGTVLISLFEPLVGIDTALSAVMATLFNIGPGLEAVGPTQNFAFFSTPSLIVLSLLMLLGRLEFFAVLVLFMPALWRKY